MYEDIASCINLARAYGIYRYFLSYKCNRIWSRTKADSYTVESQLYVSQL